MQTNAHIKSRWLGSNQTPRKYITIPYHDFNGLTQIIAEKLDLAETFRQYRTNAAEQIA